MSDAEAFTRLYFYGTVLMHMDPEQFWLTPLGLFLDLWAVYKQWNNIERAGEQASIDDIIPFDC